MKMKQHRRAGMLLTRISGLFTATNEKVLVQYGLTPVSWGVLNKIFRKPGQSTHALAEMCLLTDQSLGQIVAKLAKQGLVERTPTFGRAIIHEITAEGKSVLDEVEPLLDASITEFFSDLGAKDLSLLGDLLERVVMGKGSETLKQSILDFGKE